MGEIAIFPAPLIGRVLPRFFEESKHMTVRLTLAHLLAERIGGITEIGLEGATVGEALRSLTARFPSLSPLVWTPEGEFNDQLVLFCNGEDIRRLRSLETSIASGDELTLLTALEGG